MKVSRSSAAGAAGAGLGIAAAGFTHSQLVGGSVMERALITGAVGALVGAIVAGIFAFIALRTRARQ